MPITLRNLALFLWGTMAFGQGAQLPKYTVATLPPASSYPTYIVQVIDGSTGSDCTVGGGTYNVLCTVHAGAWGPAASGGGSATVFCPVNAQTGTTYTLVIGDGTASSTACIGTVTMTNASSNTVTVPLNSSVAFPVPDEIDFIQLGSGQTCIAAAAGVTLTTPTSLCARAENSTFGIRKIATDTWVVFGDTQ